ATLATAPPLAPTNFTGQAVSANQINLSWNGASGASDYNILRSTASGGPYSVIAMGLTTTNYSNTELSGSTTYYYVVAAVDNIGAEIRSAQIAVTTPGAPDVPTGLTALGATPGEIDLSWNASALATNYLVKRASVSG